MSKEELLYDICIIGGGINGVSTALQCAEKSYSVVLFEQNDLASGASSKTSKLAHGGLRYLKNLEFSLVRESLQERNRLLDDYPDIVKPLPFVFPVYSTFDTMKIWAGLKLYDRLAKGSQMPKSQKIDIDRVKVKVPWLSVDNIKSTFLYYDAVMDYREIVNRIACNARQRSVQILSNEKVIDSIQFSEYVKVKTTKRTVCCKVLINLTGAWNKDIVTPSKGVHLITNKLKGSTATILINPYDDRVFFTIPFKGKTIIGTTDDLYTGDPDNVHVDSYDRLYILNAINKFSTQKITTNDIVDEYVGLRPLAKSDGEAGKISRDFTIKQIDRTFSMVGGKYTTHRVMCEKLTGEVEQFLGE